jgi:NAD dependent epimerase/dehydratase family enzyme
LFKLGLGGKIGRGDFYVSWITLTDEVRALRFAIDTASLRGPVNLTAPNPVTNAEWTKALGRAVHRPAVLTVPPAALRVVLGGELVESLLSSQRVMPRKLLDGGFVFEYPTIDEGMVAALTS